MPTFTDQLDRAAIERLRRDAMHITADCPGVMFECFCAHVAALCEQELIRLGLEEQTEADLARWLDQEEQR